jgi:hypothetical protein
MLSGHMNGISLCLVVKSLNMVIPVVVKSLTRKASNLWRYPRELQYLHLGSMIQPPSHASYYYYPGTHLRFSPDTLHLK